MGTKHYITGRVRTSRYGGRYVDTYPNEPGHVFQSGTGAFAEPVWPDVLHSPDCGTASLFVEVSEQGAPLSWADVDGQMKENGVIIGDLYTTGSATYTVYTGDTITVEAYTQFPSTGSNPNLNMIVYKNGVIDYPSTNTPAVPGASLVYSSVVATGDVFHAILTSTADAPVAPISCGTSTPYSGGATFPTDNFITLGSGLGSVTLTYDAYSIPDKFEVWLEGVKVIDTGYRGDTSYQTALNTALAGMGLPPETIISGGVGTASFTKVTAGSTALVRVYAPLSGTAWTFTLGCPV